MSTWTSKSALTAAAAALALAGCAGGLDLTAGGFGAATSAPKTLAVAGRSVVVAGPDGYCIDRSVSKVAGKSAFVVMASCASITGVAEAGTPLFPALLTAAVTRTEVGGPLPDAAELKTFVASEAGRAALARDGRAASVDILESQRNDDAFLIRLRDRSHGGVENVDEVYWRGLAVLNGQLLTISVLSFPDAPLTANQGLATLRAFLARIRAESSAASSPA